MLEWRIGQHFILPDRSTKRAAWSVLSVAYQPAGMQAAGASYAVRRRATNELFRSVGISKINTWRCDLHTSLRPCRRMPPSVSVFFTTIVRQMLIVVLLTKIRL